MSEIIINDIKNIELLDSSKIETNEIISKYSHYLNSLKDYETNSKIENEIPRDDYNFSPDMKLRENKISDSFLQSEEYFSNGNIMMESNKYPSHANFSEIERNNKKRKIFHNKQNSVNSVKSLCSISSLCDATRFYHSNPPLQSSILNSVILNKSAVKGKQFFQNTVEKKNYKEKITILKNRIKMLKDQENQFNNKMKVMVTKAIKDEKLKTEKEEFKNLISNTKLENISKLENRKNIVLNEKKKRTENLEKTRENILKKKREIFESARNDKLIFETMTNQINRHILNKNNYKSVKIKHEQIEGRTLRFKKKAEIEENAKMKFDDKMQRLKEEKELFKKKLKELEETEEKCLESLRKTLKNKDLQMKSLENKNCENKLIIYSKKSAESECEKKIKTKNQADCFVNTKMRKNGVASSYKTDIINLNRAKSAWTRDNKKKY
jgi:hypothetical protein